MTLAIYKISAAFIIFAISLIAISYPLKTQREITTTPLLILGESLASGIFLGIAFFHLLPHAIMLFQTHWGMIEYPLPEIICIGAFLVLLFLERFYLSRYLIGARTSTLVFLLAISIIYSLTEGIALGIGKNFPDTTSVFAAILANKGSASFALCMTLLHFRLPMKQILGLILLFSLMTPLGIGIGLSANHAMEFENLVLAIFNAVAAGVFLYISTMHHIQFHQRLGENHHHILLEFSCFAFGVIAMGLLAVWY